MEISVNRKEKKINEEVDSFLNLQNKKRVFVNY